MAEQGGRARGVGVEDAAVAAALAREAASPFGYRAPAADLLARFGGEGPERRREADAALSLAGVVAEPPLADADPRAYVRLSRAAAPPGGPSQPPGAGTPPGARLRGAGGVPGRGRLGPALGGLLALLAVFAAAIGLRGMLDGDDERASALPPGPPPAAATAPATTAAARTPARPAAAARPSPAAAGAQPGGAAARQAAPRRVRLRVVPAEPVYLCVARPGGETRYEGIRETPYTVAGRRLVVRVGAATARIEANGRRVPVTTAPGAFELTPDGARELPGDARVCGDG